MSPVKIKLKIKLTDGITEVRTLITHPMHTGRVKDAKGQLIPAHFIQEVKVEHNEKVVVTSVLGSTVSRKPFFKFRFAGGKQGDLVRIKWVDNKGNSGSKEMVIP